MKNNARVAWFPLLVLLRFSAAGIGSFAAVIFSIAYYVFYHNDFVMVSFVFIIDVSCNRVLIFLIV